MELGIEKCATLVNNDKNELAKLWTMLSKRTTE